MPHISDKTFVSSHVLIFFSYHNNVILQYPILILGFDDEDRQCQ